MADLKGVVPAIVTPFTATGEFNESAFRQVMEYNIEAGVHGFWIAGGTGESVLLSDDENFAIASAAADQNRGRITNIMHIGAPTTRRAAAMAERATQAGVDALCCVPPFFYAATDEEIIEHYRIVATATELPLLLYNLPQSTGVNITPALAARIRERVPQVAGLKHSGPTVEDVRAFADLDLACFIGNSLLMLPGLTIGAVGCIDGPLVVVPELWVAIWKAYVDGDMQRAMAAQQRATEASMAILNFGFLGALKAAASERLKVDCGAPRPPQLPLSGAQRAELVQALRALDLLP